jgi:hypothetical protein
MNRLNSDAERLAQDAVQYLRALLLMDDRMKTESSVIRRTPPHWMARPTFESIDWDLVWDERVFLRRAGRKASGRLGLGIKPGRQDQPRSIIADDGSIGKAFS